MNQSLKKSAYSVNDYTDPFIDQSGDQGNDKSFHQVKWSNLPEHESPYVADRRLMAAPAAMMVSNGIKLE